MINSLTNWLVKDYARTSLSILPFISWFNGWLIISMIESADWPTKLCHKSVYWRLIFWVWKLFDEIYCWLIGALIDSCTFISWFMNVFIDLKAYWLFSLRLIRGTPTSTLRMVSSLSRYSHPCMYIVTDRWTDWQSNVFRSL